MGRAFNRHGGWRGGLLRQRQGGERGFGARRRKLTGHQVAGGPQTGPGALARYWRRSQNRREAVHGRGD